MKKVRSGESLTIPAATWNAFIDAANWVKNQEENRNSRGISSGLGVGIVLIKNAEAELRDRFTALVISDVAVSPKDNEDEFLSCPPVFVGVKMTEARAGAAYAILLEPIESGEIGRAMVLGVTPALVSIQDAADTYVEPVPNSTTGALRSSSTGVARILWKAGSSGQVWALLQLGGAGGGGGGGDKAYMCLVNGGSNTEGYRVTVYPNGRTDKGTESSILYVPDIALDSELPSGTWIIGHKCALRATGGSDT